MKQRFLGCLMLLVLFFSIGFLVLLFQVRHISKPERLVTQISEAGFYGEIPNLVESLATSTQTKVYAKLFNQAFSPADIKVSVDQNLPDLLNYFFGYSKVVKTNLDLKSIKTKLKTQSASSFAQDLGDVLKTLPACPAGTQIDNNAWQNCRPANLKSYVNSMSSGNFIDQWPDSYNLTGALQKNPELQKTRRKFVLLNELFWISIFLNLILLGLIVLNSKNIRATLGGIGEAILLPSIVVLIINGSASLISSLLIAKYLPAATGITKVSETFLKMNLTQFFRFGLILGGSVFILGLILIMVAHFLPHPTETMGQKTNSTENKNVPQKLS